jgi:hypothetical protein
MFNQHTLQVACQHLSNACVAAPQDRFYEAIFGLHCPNAQALQLQRQFHVSTAASASQQASRPL